MQGKAEKIKGYFFSNYMKIREQVEKCRTW